MRKKYWRNPIKALVFAFCIMTFVSCQSDEKKQTVIAEQIFPSFEAEKKYKRELGSFTLDSGITYFLSAYPFDSDSISGKQKETEVSWRHSAPFNSGTQKVPGGIRAEWFIGETKFILYGLYSRLDIDVQQEISILEELIVLFSQKLTEDR